MAAIGADGLNGDTLAGFPRIFRAASDATGKPLVLEPTDSPPPMGLAWNNMSWGDESGARPARCKLHRDVAGSSVAGEMVFDLL